MHAMQETSIAVKQLTMLPSPPHRSPGAAPTVPPFSLPTPLLYIGKEHSPIIGDNLYHIPPGQVCVPLDQSKGSVWKVKLLSGSNSGTVTSVHRNHLNEYTGKLLCVCVTKVPLHNCMSILHCCM